MNPSLKEIILNDSDSENISKRISISLNNKISLKSTNTQATEMVEKISNNIAIQNKII